MTQSPLNDRQILLVLSGGIAAYKSLDLIRLLRKGGATVRCVMTRNAARFVTPLSVSALSGHTAHVDMWDEGSGKDIDHISLARQSDLVVVAPATANLLAKMAHGIADDLASTLLLATTTPILVAPAMNVAMWRHPATQTNVRILHERGVLFQGPDKGPMACAEEGEGRMSEPSLIFDRICDILAAPKPLAGFRTLVTSGPTYEPLDPVRFIGNRSSGKQGHAIAAELARAGADVTLVTGPTAIPAPTGVRCVAIETAQQMLAACEAALPVDIAICAAAVADWRPETQQNQKIKKTVNSAAPSITLTENPDILASLSRRAENRPRLVIGFAAETQDVEKNAAEKFQRKGCDWILANQVGDNLGFARDENQVTLVARQGETITMTNWGLQPKTEIARKLVAEIITTLKG